MTKQEWPKVLGKTILSAAVLVALAGFSCEPSGKLKLSGKLASADGDGSAKFRIYTEQCGDPGAGVTGRFKYRDSNAGLKIHGRVIHADVCSALDRCEEYCAATDLVFGVDYGPEDAESPFDNLLAVCINDEGYFTMGVITGPLKGYENSGPVFDGKHSYKPCDDDDDD